jgi:argonaute-like protein implicated in RNA metabolism and viral defense
MPTSCRFDVPRRIPLGRLRTPTFYTFGEAELLDMDDRSAHVLRMRSGMLDGQLHALHEVGEEIGVSLEGVSVIQNDALVVIRTVREVQWHMRDEPTRPQYRFGRRW